MRRRTWPSQTSSSGSESSRPSTASWRSTDGAVPPTVDLLSGGLARDDRPHRDFPPGGHESLRRGGGPLPVHPGARERPGHRQWDAGDPELRRLELRPRSARPGRAGGQCRRRPRGPVRRWCVFATAHPRRARLAPSRIRSAYDSPAARPGQRHAAQSGRLRVRPDCGEPRSRGWHPNPHDRVPEAGPHEGHVQLFLNAVLNQEPRAYDLGFIVDMPDGNNTVTARLVNNDNTPLSPDVSASVTIRIQGAADPIGSEQVTGGVSLILALILVVLLLRRRKAITRLSPE